MGDTDPDPTGACGAARIAQVHAVARRRLLIAFSGGFLDQQRPGAFRFMIGQRRLPITGGDAPGLPRPFWVPRAQIHKGHVRRQQVQPGFHAEAATACRLGAGYSFRVIDPVSLRSADELYKSFCTISEDR